MTEAERGRAPSRPALRRDAKPRLQSHQAAEPCTGRGVKPVRYVMVAQPPRGRSSMAEPQPSKLVMPVRSRSPAPRKKPRSAILTRPRCRSWLSAVSRSGPHMGHRAGTSGILMGLAALFASLLHQRAESVRYRLVPVPAGVLVDQRGPGTGMTEPGHQL